MFQFLEDGEIKHTFQMHDKKVLIISGLCTMKSL